MEFISMEWQGVVGIKEGYSEQRPTFTFINAKRF